MTPLSYLLPIIGGIAGGGGGGVSGSPGGSNFVCASHLGGLLGSSYFWSPTAMSGLGISASDFFSDVYNYVDVLAALPGSPSIGERCTVPLD